MPLANTGLFCRLGCLVSVWVVLGLSVGDGVAGAYKLVRAVGASHFRAIYIGRAMSEWVLLVVLSVLLGLAVWLR